jgi:HAD superfamily hydrolase (TIGR01509 family)
VIKTVIFDMDGIMMLTETLSSRAFCKVLLGCGVVPVLKASGCVHEVGTIGNMAKLKRQYGLRQPLWWLQFKYGLAYRLFIHRDGLPMAGLLPLLEMLQKYGLPMAVASGSLDHVIKIVVKRLGIRHYFKELVSSRKLKRNKPFPDVYLETARRLKIRPAQCLVIEDSGIGVDAAKAAGMKVIAVPNQFTVHDNFALADLVVDSLKDVTWEIISSL